MPRTCSEVAPASNDSLTVPSRLIFSRSPFGLFNDNGTVLYVRTFMENDPPAPANPSYSCWDRQMLPQKYGRCHAHITGQRDHHLPAVVEMPLAALSSVDQRVGVEVAVVVFYNFCDFAVRSINRDGCSRKAARLQARGLLLTPVPSGPATIGATVGPGLGRHAPARGANTLWQMSRFVSDRGVIAANRCRNSSDSRVEKEAAPRPDGRGRESGPAPERPTRDESAGVRTPPSRPARRHDLQVQVGRRFYNALTSRANPQASLRHSSLEGSR